MAWHKQIEPVPGPHDDADIAQLYKDAQHAYQQAVEHNPYHAMAHYNLGELPLWCSYSIVPLLA
jgi:hypothetical protein